MGPRTLERPRTTRRLTATAIDALRPAPARYEVTDPACAGLQLRIEPSGAKAWIYRYYWHGRRVRLVLGPHPRITLARAHELAEQCRQALDRRIDPRRAGIVARATKVTALRGDAADQSGGPDRHSVAFLAGEFVRLHVKPRQKTPEYVQRILDRDVIPIWGERDARTVKPADVIELLDGIVERGSVVMANRVAAILGQLFKFGIHRAVVEVSPVMLLYRPGGRERPRERTLNDAELAALLAIEPLPRFERLHRAINLLLLTGQRRSELGLARWSDVDLKAKTWRIPAEISKTGRGHVVPLSEWALEEFRALKREAEGSPFVFPAAGDARAPADPKQLTRSTARALTRFEKLGIGPFTLHDLRRTCRTGLARLKVAPHVAERVLNHAQERIPGTYDVHDYLDEKREALDRWAAHLQSLVDHGREHGDA